MNKFTLFQTCTMSDEELDLYWAEIAQVRNCLCLQKIVAHIQDFRFSNCPLSLAAFHTPLEKSVSPSSLSPV